MKQSIYRTPRTYRLSPTQANKLHQTAKELGLTESQLIRSFIERGLAFVESERLYG